MHRYRDAIVSKLKNKVQFKYDTFGAYVMFPYKSVQSLTGQISWSHYYVVEVSDEGDNPPIGILLCTSKDEIVAEYSLC